MLYMYSNLYLQISGYMLAKTIVCAFACGLLTLAIVHLNNYLLHVTLISLCQIKLPHLINHAK